MSLVVYVAAALLALAAVVIYRRPAAGTGARSPLTVSTAVAIALAALVFVCSAPVTLAVVNGVTGIPNFGAPLTYGLLSAYSCSLLILLIHWRGGPPERMRRTVRRSVTAYAALIVAIVVLFVLADSDTERLADLDTYYATTPLMREMIVLYLLGHTVATVVMCVLCLKWQREVTGLLRTGLRLIMASSVLDLLGFQLTKYTAVAARWAGGDLDFLSTGVAPPLAALAALLSSAGFTLPRLLPPLRAHWRCLGDHRRLRPLWSRVGFVSTAPKPPSGWWQSPRQRLHWREVAIHDALLALAPYFDDGVREHARDIAARAGRPPHQARMAGEAEMLVDAARRAAAREQPLDPPSTYRLHATEVSDSSGLVELAHALRHSAVATAAREGTVRTSHGLNHG
ncbi:MAB_1171c family putative transporter [Streptomyces sp. NPDC048290]|uniref:MAB_1171c family putative transporter n=1 Tax=Streptomyces sp. NPDC048290 TaxID=3155811 RepID=UPI003423C92C